eukprot:5464525-Prymnesium_polylepis.2
MRDKHKNRAPKLVGLSGLRGTHYQRHCPRCYRTSSEAWHDRRQQLRLPLPKNGPATGAKNTHKS